MKHLKRRAILSAAAVSLLLLLAGISIALRPSTTRALPAQSEQLARETDDPMTRFKTEREQLRARQRASLNDIIHDPGTEDEIRAAARRQLLELMEREATELELEGLLRARGFDEVLVSMGGGAVNVLAPASALDRNSVAMILDLVLRQTGVTSGNVKIMPIN